MVKAESTSVGLSSPRFNHPRSRTCAEAGALPRCPRWAAFARCRHPRPGRRAESPNVRRRYAVRDDSRSGVSRPISGHPAPDAMSSALRRRDESLSARRALPRTAGIKHIPDCRCKGVRSRRFAKIAQGRKADRLLTDRQPFGGNHDECPLLRVAVISEFHPRVVRPRTANSTALSAARFQLPAPLSDGRARQSRRVRNQSIASISDGTRFRGRPDTTPALIEKRLDCSVLLNVCRFEFNIASHRRSKTKHP